MGGKACFCICGTIGVSFWYCPCLCVCEITKHHFPYSFQWGCQAQSTTTSNTPPLKKIQEIVALPCQCQFIHIYIYVCCGISVGIFSCTDGRQGRKSAASSPCALALASAPFLWKSPAESIQSLAFTIWKVDLNSCCERTLGCSSILSSPRHPASCMAMSFDWGLLGCLMLSSI